MSITYLVPVVSVSSVALAVERTTTLLLPTESGTKVRASLPFLLSSSVPLVPLSMPLETLPSARE